MSTSAHIAVAAEPRAGHLETRILADQVRLLAEQTRAAFAGNIIVMLIIEWALWYRVDRWLLLAWGAALAGAMATRAVVASRYLAGVSGAGDVRPWRYRFMWAIGLVGLCWGLLPVLFFPADSPWLATLMVLLLSGLTAAGIGSLSAYLPAYYVFAVPIMGAMTVRFLVDGSAIASFVGLAGTVYLATCLIWARNMHRVTRDSIELRFENVELVEQLRRQKNAADRAREAAEQASVAKSRFLAAASHDLRQPLHALGLYVGLLEDEHDPARIDGLVSRIRDSSKALEALFNALLDISRLDADRVKVERRHFRLMDLFQRLASEFGVQARKKGLRLRLVPTSAVVYSDPVLVERILRNLLSNALRYTERGKVLLGCRRGGDQARVVVMDTGPGIADTEQDRVFDEFHQLHNPERDRNKGLGLGLAIVRRLAGLLGHDIELRSQPGRGAAFCLHLPLGRTQHLNDWNSAPLTASPGLPACTVLVIDDEASIREAMRSVLQGWGCRVLCADSVEQALARLTDGAPRPDLLLSDYRLRERASGIDAIRAVRQALGEEIPALLISGDTAPEVLRIASAFGCPLLHKPVPPAKLRAAMGALLAGAPAC